MSIGKVPTDDAPPSPAETREADMDLVQTYYSNDGVLCNECPCYIREADTNFFGCKILLGDAELYDAPCL